MTIATDTEPLDVLIAQTERRLLEAVSEAVEQLGWRCSFIELYLDGSSLTANARLSINRTLERLEPEVTCRNCGCNAEEDQAEATAVGARQHLPTTERALA